MKTSRLLLVLLLSSTMLQLWAKPPKFAWKQVTSNGYTYRTVEGDPMQTRFYTLKNGLTVITRSRCFLPCWKEFSLPTITATKHDWNHRAPQKPLADRNPQLLSQILLSQQHGYLQNTQRKILLFK